MEAGYDKIPKTRSLGNEIAIFRPFDEKAIWGHVSRNAYMSLKFLEYMNPYIKVDKAIYKQGLIFNLRIIGCVKLDTISVVGRNHLILSEQYQPDTGHHLVNMVITDSEKYLPDLDFEFSCDSHWHQATQS